MEHSMLSIFFELAFDVRNKARRTWHIALGPTDIPHRCRLKRKKTDSPREGWEDGTPPPHRDFKERCVMR